MYFYLIFRLLRYYPNLYLSFIMIMESLFENNHLIAALKVCLDVNVMAVTTFPKDKIIVTARSFSHQMD